MTPSEVLRKARATIEAADFIDARTVLEAAHGDEVNVDAADYLRHEVGMAITIWFRQKRTLAEVLSLFDRAIAAAEARGE